VPVVALVPHGPDRWPPGLHRLHARLVAGEWRAHRELLMAHLAHRDPMERLELELAPRTSAPSSARRRRAATTT